MSAKPVVILAASMLLGAIVGAPNVALAQFGPPPGPPPMLAGPPPGPSAGAPLPALTGGPRLPAPAPAYPSGGPVGAAPRDFAGRAPRLDRAEISLGRGEARLRGIDGRAAASVANNAARYGGNGSYGRRYRSWPYAAAAAAYAYGSSYASRDGCYYVSTYRAYGTRRVLICDGE
ncbi:MAG TPA: hypothetical protein VMU69_32495 [Bradyrhizobium sp.]|nr:hypothetical protein [Bradyrhizobium sp.]